MSDLCSFALRWPTPGTCDDSAQHLSQLIEDELRDHLLGTYGIRVLRVDADAVMGCIDQVVEFLDGVSSGKILPAIDAEFSAPFPRLRGARDGGLRKYTTCCLLRCGLAISTPLAPEGSIST
jgi:hypothetical protein